MLNKKILICVTGGIAVYKAVALVSKLIASRGRCESDDDGIGNGICHAAYVSGDVT